MGPNMTNSTIQSSGAQISVVKNGAEITGDVDFLLESGVQIAAILGKVKEKHQITVKNQHAAALEALTGDSTPAERDTWPPKVAFAREFLAGEATEAAQAAAEQALLPGETLQSYCQVVAAKEAAFFQMSMFAEGFKRKTNAAIEAAETIEALDATMTQAASDMATAIESFKAQLAAA